MFHAIIYKEYRDSKRQFNVIAVGGDKLSRGLTLEGLITSYFYRNTSTSFTGGTNYSYHPNYRNFTHSYTMVFCGDSISDANTAILNTYKKAFTLEDPLTTYSSKINI